MYIYDSKNMHQHHCAKNHHHLQQEHHSKHTIMPIYSSDSDDPMFNAHTRLFGRDRPLHHLLGRGKLADIMLWKNKHVSGAILAGVTTIWFLFEVVEYQFVTLLCHMLILSMLVIFAWTKMAGLIKRNPPDIRKIMLSESAFRSLLARFNWFLLKLCYISCGRDLKGFFLTVTTLWILSVVGNYISSLNLLYTVFLCALTIPVMYEKYEKEVDYLAIRGNQDIKRAMKKFEARVLNKIPRGPVKERKRM